MLAFIANRFRQTEQRIALEKAAETFAKTHKKGRYIHFLQDVAGWCKWLGKTYQYYYDIVYLYAKEKQRDIKTAWKYSRPLEFKNQNKEYKYDLVKYTEKAIDYLKETEQQQDKNF